MNMTGRVVVVDVEMPFWSMVTLMVKWTIASIPAFLILALLAFGVTLALAVPLGLLAPR